MIKIYGYSDDLIEIDGDWQEEFGVTDSDPRWLTTSTGALIRASFDNDEWHFRVRQTGEGGHHVYPVGLIPTWELCGNDYSDVVVIDEPVRWVTCGSIVVASSNSFFRSGGL